jgi:hypothetical protein
MASSDSAIPHNARQSLPTNFIVLARLVSSPRHPLDMPHYRSRRIQLGLLSEYVGNAGYLAVVYGPKFGASAQASNRLLAYMFGVAFTLCTTYSKYLHLRGCEPQC